MRSFPSTKEKKRYLVFEVISQKKHEFGQIRETIKSAISYFSGNLGLAKSRPRILADKWDEKRQIGIIAVERKNTDKVRASFCMLREIGKAPAIIRTIGSSGILKKAIQKHYSQ